MQVSIAISGKPDISLMCYSGGSPGNIPFWDKEGFYYCPPYEQVNGRSLIVAGGSAQPLKEAAPLSSPGKQDMWGYCISDVGTRIREYIISKSKCMRMRHISSVAYPPV
jgi:hypothetical protein